MKNCFLLLLLLLVVNSCTVGSNNDNNNVVVNTKQVTVSWVANREKLVNTLGGGYTIFYSTQSNVDLFSANSVDVPYVAGASAPTSVVLDLAPAYTYYVRVVAYSTINGKVFTSIPSAEQTISLK